MFAILGCAFILGCLIALIIYPIKSIKNAPQEMYDQAAKKKLKSYGDLADGRITEEEYYKIQEEFNEAQAIFTEWQLEQIAKQNKRRFF